MATLSEVFTVLNKLEAEGVIQRYAVAGAMALLFYTEPARTYDLDIFVFLPPQEGRIFSMRPLYDELRTRGFAFKAEHVLIDDTPVQFIPAYNPLAIEALETAAEHTYEGVTVRVLTPEYLVALAYQAGGKHRLARAEALIAEDLVDTGKLEAILATHHVLRGD